MGKLLSWLLLAALGYAAYRLFVSAKRRAAGTGGKAGSPAATTVAEPMARCELCGLHLPRSEAVADGGRWFCSEAHRDQARGAR